LVSSVADVYQVANATFPLQHGRLRSISLDLIQGVEGRVVVSRADVKGAQLIVESTWAGEGLIDAPVELTTGGWYDSLSIKVCHLFYLWLCFAD
jgi:hypothetical protein